MAAPAIRELIDTRAPKISNPWEAPGLSDAEKNVMLLSALDNRRDERRYYNPSQTSGGPGGISVPLALMLDQRGDQMPDRYFQGGAPTTERNFFNTLNYGHPGQGTVLEQRIGIGPEDLAARRRQQTSDAYSDQLQKLELMRQLMGSLRANQVQPYRPVPIGQVGISGIDRNMLNPIEALLR